MKNDDVLTEWDEKNEEQVDKKSAKKLVWRTRLSISLTVLRTLFIIGFLYLLYIIPVSVYYDMSGKEAEFNRLVSTLVETHHPGLFVEKFGLENEAEISPLLTESTSLTLYRNVGDWEVVIGEVTANKRLFGKVNYTFHFDDKYLYDNNYTFSYAVAPDLLGESFIHDESEPDSSVKSQLEKIEDGFVAQAHFSTKESMDPEELREMLADYDVKIYQMPVFGGETTAVDVGKGKAGQFTFVPSLMLSPFTEYNDKNGPRASYESLTSESALNDAVDQFYKDIDWLIEHGNYSGRDIDEKRLEYLKGEGIQVYGAMVTGPIREIERLQEEELFHQFYIGGIEVWNWNENKQ
ncbi:anti sigma factor C-terminal domain-containing protein [Virgibacillus byunsanensis]|uniref:Anti sigma factor C-terminal domain-containing protein n=1 Tax=Virgibacillus byunsanensis TaxID=570945 RepID=A0ABW3LNG1_9BACI